MTSITRRDKLAMDPVSETSSSAYGAAMSGNWEAMIKYYQSRASNLFHPVTYSNDTALHIAVCSQKELPLKNLLDSIPSEEPFFEEDLLNRQNKDGNTVLHEATIYGNYEAVKLLVERCPDMVSIENEFGETPLFTAAEFAGAEIVKFLLLSVTNEIVDDNGRLKSIHRQRSLDDVSILTAAILGQHYETALMLLEVDESLHSLKDNTDLTALHILAHAPSAFKSGYPMGIHKRLIYSCLPVVRLYKVKLQKETLGRTTQGSGDLESGSARKRRGVLLNYLNVHIKGRWPARLQGFWNEKRKHVFALTLAKILIKKDMSWDPVGGQEYGPKLSKTSLTTQQVTGVQDKKEEENDKANEGPSLMQPSPYQSGDESDIESKEGGDEIIFEGKEIVVARRRPAQTSATKSSLTMKENPLFTATKNGIEEIVRGIIEEHPQAIEYLNDKSQSILDVAVMHRKKEIFSLIKQKKISLARLRRLTDNERNTLLHHVANMEHYKRGTKPGPALQLQEELQWLKRVRKVMPSPYVMLLNEKNEKAEDLFETNHGDQLKKAQKWMKETTQSCSTVAALVATVVFAAAYTVPGGSDEEGTPNFINSPYFLVFTVSDVVSLACSLTSLVMFLSLMASPFELKDFHVSLPRKLMIGFTLLFFSVMTTMLSFGATILILIQSERKLTTLLLSIAAFLPVFVFAIMQFRLYVSFMGSTFNFRKIIKKTLPCLVRLLQGGKKRW